MRWTLAVLLAMVLTLASGTTMARETVPIENHQNLRVIRTDNLVLTEARVRQAMLNAAQKANFRVNEDGPGRLVVSQSWNNKHTMLVEIQYSLTNYSVLYNGSVNLNYFRYGKLGPEIHPAYNQRVKTLLAAIAAELQIA